MKKPVVASLLNDYHLLAYDEVDSTNDEAKRLAIGGASHGAVLWAKRQTNGKGRQGRKWISQEGNLFVSFLLSPPCDIKRATQLSFVAAIAALEAIQPLLPEGSELECKWPNDLILGGKKLGGILLESFEHEGRRWVVIGIGVNVESAPQKTEHLPAISLHDAGVEIVSAKIVLSRLIHHFIERYNEWNHKGFSPIRVRWIRHAWGAGKLLRVVTPEREVRGIGKGIDREGGLILHQRGRDIVVHAGDVFLEEKARRRT